MSYAFPSLALTCRLGGASACFGSAFPENPAVPPAFAAALAAGPVP